MRKIFHLILIFTFIKAHAQYPIVTDTIKNAGIYRTFEEFRDNSPSLKVNFGSNGFKIVNNDVRYASSSKKERLKIFGFDMPYKMARNIGPIFGFCDGDKIYITVESEQYPDFKAFYKVEKLAEICYFDALSLNFIDAKPNPLNFNQNKKITQLINLKTAEYSRLSKKFINELLSNYPELLNKFEVEKDKNLKLKEYLEEYLKL